MSQRPYLRFSKKSKGTLSLVSTEWRQEWEAYFSLAHLIKPAYLYYAAVVCWASQNTCSSLGTSKHTSKFAVTSSCGLFSYR